MITPKLIGILSVASLYLFRVAGLPSEDEPIFGW